MADAIFIFHGLFPDVVDNNHRSIAKILFDIDFDNHLHSHCLADIEQIAPNEFEIRGQLPIDCPGFAQAALDYYRYAIGPQKNTISHSGPKGTSLATHNVIRAQWSTRLEAKALTEAT